jgi:hypothetical protein
LPAFAGPWHFHPEYELTYIVSGSDNRIGDSIAPSGPGDLVLIGADLPHVWRSAAKDDTRMNHTHSVVIHFDEDSSGKGFLDLPELQKASKLLVRAPKWL